MEGVRSHYHQDRFIRLEKHQDRFVRSEKHVQPGLEVYYVKIIIELMDVDSHTIIQISLSNKSI